MGIQSAEMILDNIQFRITKNSLIKSGMNIFKKKISLLLGNIDLRNEAIG